MKAVLEPEAVGPLMETPRSLPLYSDPSQLPVSPKLPFKKLCFPGNCFQCMCFEISTWANQAPSSLGGRLKER